MHFLELDMVELGLDGTAAPKPTDLSIDERLNSAEQLREAANEKFRSGDLAAARKDYSEVLKLLAPRPIERSLEAVQEEKRGAAQERAKNLRLPTLLNLALCCLKADPCEAFRALELCEEALELDPDNAKASFRKGKALAELGEVKEAEWELIRACKLAPGDAGPRKELELLRARSKSDALKEKEMLQGLFEKKPGFASEGRVSTEAAGQEEPRTDSYSFFKDPASNPFASSGSPEEDARSAQTDGRLEDAVWAWEAALYQSAASSDAAAHCSSWLELARLFMDLNIDALALKCLRRASGECLDDASAQVPPDVRRNALLLRAVCLLNEAESDPEAEVAQCLEDWLAAAEGAEGGSSSSGSSEAVEAKLESLRGKVKNCADVAVAQGLVYLVRGRKEDAGKVFSEALVALVDEASCFGGKRQLATRWNMLGAVLANMGRHDKALLAYQEALGLQPHYPRAQMNLCIAKQVAGEHAEAARVCAAALRDVPAWAATPLWAALRKAAQDHRGADPAQETLWDSVVLAAEEKDLVKVLELLPARAPEK